MPRYKILKYPERLLAQRAQEVHVVDEDIRRLIKGMFTMMYKDGGVGLAAPQIGVSKRIFVANPEGVKGGSEYAFINPVLSDFQGEVWGPEGCLSLPGISAEVPRAQSLDIDALDGRGQPMHLRAEDFLARIIQHETDHLDGKLFVDRLAYIERQKLLTEYESGKKASTKVSSDEYRFFRFL